MARSRARGIVRGALLATALGVSLLGAEALARADGPDASQIAARQQVARKLYDASAKDQQRGEFAAALEKLRSAATVMNDHLGVRVNTALCEEQLGQLVPALVHYEDAARFAARDSRPDILEKAIKPALQRLRERVPRVKINLPPEAADAEVKLDGVVYPAAILAEEIRVEIGSHTVEAAAEGKGTFSRTIEAAEKSALVVNVRLEKSAAPARAVTAGATPTTPTARPLEPPPEPPRRRDRTWAMASTAGAVVLVGAGVGAFLRAGKLASDGDTACRTRLPGQCDDLRAPVRTWDAIALGAWIGAAGLGAVAVVSWMSPSKNTAILVGPGAIGYGGRF